MYGSVGPRLYHRKHIWDLRLSSFIKHAHCPQPHPHEMTERACAAASIPSSCFTVTNRSLRFLSLIGRLWANIPKGGQCVFAYRCAKMSDFHLVLWKSLGLHTG